ncbi:ABC transporter permease [Phyllobacterium myrsinacearum]|uniref:Peptide/nickel transport system permease protein n=1 Tax=Phyllobacterium myrsinacearum TaxID=28101 RepID=A0A839EQ35_9HYPH|nr:ABC transporter permease [Phyllobacterium myrsinacearum]MBA8880989.1 peptide/nickel transport system permease protein [Phyllobacterium myrsinacearum]
MADISHPSAFPSAMRKLKSPALRRALSEPATVFGLVLVAIHLFLAVFGPWIATHDTSALVGDPMQIPSWDFLMGTDQIGRDYFSRIINGGRIALMVSFFGVSLALFVGTALGITAGYIGGRVDEIIMRIVDAMMSIPELILIAILTLALGKDVLALIPVIAIVYTWGAIRVIRAKTISLSMLDFVRAAELRGESRWAIIAREIFPNLTGILGVELAVRISSAVLRISALSFLGLGISQPTPDWGLMVQEAMGVVFTDPWFLLLPALMLSSLIVGVNFMVDGLSRAFGISSSELG